MAGPITWRNINGPSPAEASRPLEAAGRSFDGALDILGRLIQQREVTANQNFETGQTNLQSQYRDLLAGAKTPEQLAALEQSGQLAQALQGMTGTSRSAVRGADEERATAVRNILGQQQQFEDAQRKRAEEPIRQAYLDATYRGDKKAAAGILQANPNISDLANLRKEGISWDRDNQRYIWEGEEHGFAKNQDARAERTTEDQLKNSALTRKLNGLRIQDAQLDLKEKKLSVDDKAQLRNIEKLTAGAAAAEQQRKWQGRDQLGALASANGMPVDSNGHPDVDEMTSDQLNQLDVLATVNGVPNWRSVFRGDTATADKYFQSLNGQFSPELLARAKQSIYGAFDSSGLGSAIGDDRAASQLAQAREDVIQKEKDANNWYTPGTGQAREIVNQLAADVPNLIDKASGNSPEEDIAGVQGFLYEMATKGLEIRPGVFMTPSKEDLTNAIRTAKGGWWLDSRRKSNVEKVLRENLDASRVTKLLEEAEESKVAARRRAVREIMNPEKKK